MNTTAHTTAARYPIPLPPLPTTTTGAATRSPTTTPPHSPVQLLPSTVALSWGAFLLDGLLETPVAPYTRRKAVLSCWSLPFDQLIQHNNHVLLYLAQRVAPYWQHPLMAKPALFESLVVNGIGDYIARHLIEYDGAYPEPAAYQAQIDMYLGLFFPDVELLRQSNHFPATVAQPQGVHA
ncbi:MAG: hypothetical protein ACEQSD_01040 [Flavobacteriales bacterium]